MLLVAVLAFPMAAGAQPMPPSRPPAEGLAPGPGIDVPPLAAVPPPVVNPAEPRGTATLSLSAAFPGDGRPIRAGLVWRIYEEKSGAPPELVTRLTAPAPSAPLLSGAYLIHVTYGLASASKRVYVGSGAYAEKLVLAAGALKLGGAIEAVPIPPERLSFNIYLPVGNDREAQLLAAKVKAGDLVRLPEGTYHVVSNYGDSNAIMRADLKVEAGRITEATVNHRAATVTLKLVAQPGGEAFAGTAFSVLTPGGDVIREATGSFPTVTLAEGDYVVIARHNGKVYTREVKVESGVNGDVEVLVSS